MHVHCRSCESHLSLCRVSLDSQKKKKKSVCRVSALRRVRFLPSVRTVMQTCGCGRHPVPAVEAPTSQPRTVRARTRSPPAHSSATMGGGNLQKSQMARERNQAKMGKEGAGGGGTEGMAKRHADASVFAAAQAERAAQKAAQEATRAAKAEKAAAAERRAPLAIARPARTPHCSCLC